MMAANTRGTRVPALALAMLVLAAATLLPSTASAIKPTWGLRLGLTEARLHGATAGDILSDYHPGFAVGVTAALPIGSALSIQPELCWVEKGGEGDFDFTGTPGRAEFRLGYLELPVLVRWSIPTGGAIAPYVIAGPSVALRVTDDTRIKFNPFLYTAPVPAARLRYARIFEQVGAFDHPNFSDWDFGVLGGAGAIIGSGRMRVAVEARYERGFVSIYPEGGNTRNGVIATTLGVELH